ncbi:hypothetical protein [Mycobacterium lepromatosis]|nr:hypothetical protein [Mycobacterium lepromatosis]
MVAATTEMEPAFRLMCSTAVTGVIMRADVTVACDGCSSTMRSAITLTPRSFDAPMDVW